MSMVALVSGGIDSTIMVLWARDEGIDLYPLFIDYGQLSADREWDACVTLLDRHNIPQPVRMSVTDYGKIVPSGLTDRERHVNLDAYLPMRNLLFLVMGAGYASSVGASSVLIGLLDERSAVFPDQTSGFLEAAEEAISLAGHVEISIIAPLLHLGKSEIVELAKARGISGTYSCHRGEREPCGVCISCIEIRRATESDRRR